jgi:hypothetical protein
MYRLGGLDTRRSFQGVGEGCMLDHCDEQAGEIMA